MSPARPQHDRPGGGDFPQDKEVAGSDRDVVVDLHIDQPQRELIEFAWDKKGKSATAVAMLSPTVGHDALEQRDVGPARPLAAMLIDAANPIKAAE
jgi:hypothetical protein